MITHPQFKVSKSLTFDGSTPEVVKMICGMSDDPEISVEEMLQKERNFHKRLAS